MYYYSSFKDPPKNLLRPHNQPDLYIHHEATLRHIRSLTTTNIVRIMINIKKKAVAGKKRKLTFAEAWRIPTAKMLALLRLYNRAKITPVMI